MPMASPAPTAPVACGISHRSTLPKMDGGTIPIEYKESNFKDRYLDEYTGEVLPKHRIRNAIEDELNYLNGKVWKLSTVAGMEKSMITYWFDLAGLCARKEKLIPQTAVLGSCLANLTKTEKLTHSPDQLLHWKRRNDCSPNMPRPGKRDPSHCDCHLSTFVKQTLTVFLNGRFT